MFSLIIKFASCFTIGKAHKWGQGWLNCLWGFWISFGYIISFFFGEPKLIIAIVGSNVASKDDQTRNT